VALNHGTLEAVIPGREAQDAVLRLRDYAAEVGKLHVGDQDDPTVSVALEGVDVRPLLDQEKVQNSPGARRRRIRELLFTTLGLTETDAELAYQLEWRGTIRRGTIRFGNVREMDDSVLEAKPGDDFRVVVDYPFDDPEHHPREDEARVQQFIDRGKDSATLVWLPSFFSDRLQRDLGDLVVIEHIMRKDSQTLVPLSPEDKARALAELGNLAEQKRARIRRALTSAYGVTAASEGDLDDTRRVEKNMYLLRQGLKLAGSIAADLKTALDKGIGDLLYQSFPRHPMFSERVTQPKLTKALERFQQVCDAEGHRVQIDKAERKDFDLSAELTLLSVTDTWASLRPATLQEVERHLAAKGQSTPTARQVATAFDPEGVYGLQRDVRDFQVLAFAAWGARQLRRDGHIVQTPKIGQVHEDAELEKPPLPSAAEFSLALDKAGQLFGIALGGRALNPRNVVELVTKLEASRKNAVVTGAAQIAGLLLKRTAFLTLEPTPGRIVTAQKAVELLDLLDEADAVQLVRNLAGFQAQTSVTALQRHLADAGKVREALQDELRFRLFGDLQQVGDAEGGVVLSTLKTALESDQIQVELAGKVHELALDAQRILAPRRPVYVPPRLVVVPDAIVLPTSVESLAPNQDMITRGSQTGSSSVVSEEWTRALEALSHAGEGAELVLNWQVVRRQP
jgi:hypothetical protein